MSMKLSSALILRKISCNHLQLVRGEGYWYFVYDDVTSGNFDTHSVYCMYLGEGLKDLNFWVAEGKGLVSKFQAPEN